MKRRISCFACAALLLALILWTIWGNTALEVNEYTITSEKIPDSFDGFRIAQISDLHNAEFGAHNEQLLNLLRDAAPDIIVITGDLVDSRNTRIDIALRFAEAAVKIAPCYYVTGNHESRIAEYPLLKAGLIDIGVTVLENEAVMLEQGGEAITLLGVDDPDFQTFPISTRLDSLVPENTYTVLLSHRPELFDTYASCGIDLVFSGHAHGGQFRLPFIGGLAAPHQGLFPKYDSGLYTDGTTNMLVSRGIGNSIFPFRFNNPPEIVVVTLFSQF